MLIPWHISYRCSQASLAEFQEVLPTTCPGGVPRFRYNIYYPVLYKVANPWSRITSFASFTNPPPLTNGGTWACSCFLAHERVYEPSLPRSPTCPRALGTLSHLLRNTEAIRPSLRHAQLRWSQPVLPAALLSSKAFLSDNRGPLVPAHPWPWPLLPAESASWCLGVGCGVCPGHLHHLFGQLSHGGLDFWDLH